MSNKAAATYHPHPSYTAMEAAWDPVRREQANHALAQAIEQYNTQQALTRKWATGNIAKQRRPRP